MTDAEAIARAYHSIPDDADIKRMSFVELAALLSSCKSGSARFNFVERELKKHLAKDQAEINRKNVILGACMGGVFGLVGVVVGAWLKNSSPTQQIGLSNTVQQMQSDYFAVKPPAANPPLSASPITQPASGPAPVQINAQPTKPNP